MKHFFLKWLLMALFLNVSLSFAEVYTWVDKDGKKHFGQEVPKEYANKGKVVDLKTMNVMEKTNANPTSFPTPTNYQEPQAQSEPEAPAEKLSACELKKREYEKSVACYASCRFPKDNRGSRVNNVAGCGHCVDVKKPDC